VYNDCNHNESIDAVSELLARTYPNDIISDDDHVILAGDFNRYHSWWEEDRNAHLTSSEAALKPLLDVIYRYDFRMALPPNRPTLQALSTGNWTRPDNVWCTSHSIDLVVKCDTDPGRQGPNTDHLPILTTLDFPLTRPPHPQTQLPSYRLERVHRSPSQLLLGLPPPQCASPTAS
jgi:hypothetical protein